MSAIFISHSSRDGAAADEMRRWLEDQGHRSVFLDFNPDSGIAAGQDWEQTLYREIKSCRAVIVLCSTASMDSKWCFTEITHARAMGKELFPVRLDDCVVEGVFSDRQVVDFAQGKAEAYERLRIGLMAAGLDPADAFDWDNSRPPYPGLVAFQEDDAAIYFGRDDEIRDGLDRLGKIHRLGTTAMLMVLGASGTGKSSLVRAGLMPRIRRDTDRWIVLDPLRPHDDMVRGVARAISRAFDAAGRSVPASDIEARLNAALDQVGASDPKTAGNGGPTARIVFKGGDNPLLALAEELRAAHGNDEARVLMIVDQFEELLGDPTASGTRFLALLRHAVERQDGPLVVLGTMRSDFLKELQEDPALIHLDGESLSLGPMPASGFVDMIAKPAALSGIELEDGLIGQMVSDAEDSGALPLLAFTLQQLHDRFGKDKHLELSEYRNLLGGLRGSIATVADELVRGVTPENMDLLRKAFLSMTRVTEDGVFARRPRRRDELPEPIHDLIQNFVDSGLLVTRGDGDVATVEVAHEALYTSWALLEGWLNQSAEALRLQHDIDVAARQWDEGGRLPEDLLRGGRLERSRELIDSGDLPLADVDLQFIEASEEAEAAEAKAAARRRRRVLQGVTVGLVLALGLSAFALFAWQRAVRASEAAASARLTTVAQASAENDTEKGMLAAVASLGITPTPNAWSALATALSQPVLARAPLEDHVAAVSGLAVSPDGSRLASVDWDGSLRIWDFETGAVVGEQFDEGRPLWANAVAFSPDGATLAFGGFDASDAVPQGFGGIWLRDGTTGAPIGEPLTGHTDEVLAIAYSRDGSQLVSSSLDGAVLRWDLTSTPPSSSVLLIADEQRSVGPVAFHPDGSRILVGGYDYGSEEDLAGMIWAFDAASGTELGGLPAHFLDVLGLAFSPSGDEVASVSLDGTLALWGGDSLEFIGETQVGGSDAWADAVSFSTDGRSVATANSDGTVSVFDGQTGNLIQDPLTAHRGGSLAVAFGPGVLITGGADNNIRRYDLNAGQSIGRQALNAEVFAWSAFAPDGSLIASIDFEEAIHVWNVEAGAAVGDPIVVGEDFYVDSVALSPDGRLILAIGGGLDADSVTMPVLVDATTGTMVGEPMTQAVDPGWAAFSPDGVHLGIADFFGALQIWDLRLGPAPVAAIESPDTAAWLGFSPDGSSIVATDYEGTLTLWDVETGTQVGSALSGHRGAVNAVAFSPDGQRLASASDDKTVILWDLETGEPVGEPLLGHGGRVLSVAFSPDGNGLASAGEDTTVVMRRIDDPDNPITLSGHRGQVSSVAYVSEGSAVVSAGDNGAVRLWPTPDFWQPLTCRAAGRNLTLAEWESIVGTERAYERQCSDFPSGEGAPADARVVTVEY